LRRTQRSRPSSGSVSTNPLTKAVNQNYIGEETLLAANAKLVSAQIQIAPHTQGDGEVASADGIYFVVLVATVNVGPDPKYSLSAGHDLLQPLQFSGLNVIAGAPRLVVLAVVLEQRTELQPTKIMTDHHVEPNEEKVSTIQRARCWGDCTGCRGPGECWTVPRLTSYSRLVFCNA
jgi:hypothetical protein